MAKHEAMLPRARIGNIIFYNWKRDRLRKDCARQGKTIKGHKTKCKRFWSRSASVEIAQVYLKYKKAGVPAELHIYSNAGHGFGLRKNIKGPVSQWLQRFVEWMNDTVFR
jgi:hypothetical protein